MKRLTAPMVLSLAMFSASAFTGERVDQRLDAPADGIVSINNLAGSVRVTGWDRREVRVEGELDDRVERLEFENDGEFTRIKVIYPRNLDGSVTGSDLNIRVPAGSRLEVSTVSADADVRAVTGSVRAGTVSGNVTLDGSSTDYSLESVSGNVRLDGTPAGSRVKANSVSGDVQLGRIQGELEAGSISGDVTVSGGRLTRAEVGSTSGDVEITADFAGSGVFRFKTISGDVVLRLTRPAGVFDVTTFSGEIDNDFGPEPQRTGRYSPGMELKFRQGEGDSEFRVNTLSGDISLRRN